MVDQRVWLNGHGPHKVRNHEEAREQAYSSPQSDLVVSNFRLGWASRVAARKDRGQSTATLLHNLTVLHNNNWLHFGQLRCTQAKQNKTKQNKINYSNASRHFQIGRAHV